ncbi:3-deoxy-D-manno-octulosonate 8-phosphate phosphatase [Helicobacter monodelphidis]|uniref:KdsC family phosphatase n=1 Tax=Helicobacter sp. 15-1451 TaxID=2004995 RepID=UPI000DCEB1E4|nr:HAD hydrolase family protein [Helicobacter sp. 15-1451]RAX58872.1 3-deoxy-D-manno-octulosonate 8-phosphate phosphatase [Helicobacter sp. 15-1451]
MIKLILLDVDGTLNDGKITYDSNGNEIKSFNVKDGLAIVCWLKLGRHIAIITGRKSHVVEMRAKELGISLLFQGIEDKGHIVRKIREEYGFKKKEIAAIGDDLNDIKMFKESSLNFAPQDCSWLVMPHIDHHLKNNGGCGAVREMVETILLREGRLDEFLALWK